MFVELYLKHCDIDKTFQQLKSMLDVLNESYRTHNCVTHMNEGMIMLNQKSKHSYKMYRVGSSITATFFKRGYPLSSTTTFVILYKSVTCMSCRRSHAISYDMSITHFHGSTSIVHVLTDRRDAVVRCMRVRILAPTKASVFRHSQTPDTRVNH